MNVLTVGKINKVLNYFFNNNTYLGIKPTAGYYLLKGRQLAFKLSLTNIFQRDDFSKQSFGYWNFALAAKLF